MRLVPASLVRIQHRGDLMWVTFRPLTDRRAADAIDSVLKRSLPQLDYYSKYAASFAREAVSPAA